MLATIKALEVYGISIVISMVVAVLIKVLVVLTGRVNKPAAAATATPAPQQPKAETTPTGIPAEVVAALTGAIAAVAGPHRVLHIAESNRSWANSGRSAQHSHQPRH